MPIAYSDARYFVTRGDYKLLKVDDTNLSDLELAVIGYILVSPKRDTNDVKFPSQIRDLPNPARSMPYDVLQRLIFEYLKFNDPNELTRLIGRNVGSLVRRLTYLRKDIAERGPHPIVTEKIRRVEVLKAYFLRLSSGDVDKLTFEKFYPPEFLDMFGVGFIKSVKSGTFFARNCLGLVKNLVSSGLLLEYYDPRDHNRAYLTLNPDTNIQTR